MLTIETFPLGPLATNAYLLVHPDGERGVIIDPGMQPDALLQRIEHLHIEAILLTHAHFDHIGGVDAIRKLKGCPVYLHDAEAEWLTNAKLNGSLNWSEISGPIETEPAEYALDHGQIVTMLDTSFKVMHTPGHSPGSVSFLYENHLFSGDVLFAMSVGRTDLRGGSSNDLYDSIHQVLFPLGDAVHVYPGHGPATTIGREKEHNPYV